MSLNGQEEELSFSQRASEQASLSAHITTQTSFIKTKDKGLRAFIFYRNYLSLKKATLPVCSTIVYLKKKRPYHAV